MSFGSLTNLIYAEEGKVQRTDKMDPASIVSKKSFCSSRQQKLSADAATNKSGSIRCWSLSFRILLRSQLHPTMASGGFRAARKLSVYHHLLVFRSWAALSGGKSPIKIFSVGSSSQFINGRLPTCYILNTPAFQGSLGFCFMSAFHT